MRRKVKTPMDIGLATINKNRVLIVTLWSFFVILTTNAQKPKYINKIGDWMSPFYKLEAFVMIDSINNKIAFIDSNSYNKLEESDLLKKINRYGYAFYYYDKADLLSSNYTINLNDSIISMSIKEFSKQYLNKTSICSYIDTFKSNKNLNSIIFYFELNKIKLYYSSCDGIYYCMDRI